MEGRIQVKRSFFWSERYAIIQDGELKYYQDDSMNLLKLSFRLKDHSIVQDRQQKTIKLLLTSSNSEVLRLKCDLHDLWYTKLIQAKVQSMNFNYLPLHLAQEQIRNGSSNANPNSTSSAYIEPLIQLRTNSSQPSNQQNQQDIQISNLNRQRAQEQDLLRMQKEVQQQQQLQQQEYQLSLQRQYQQQQQQQLQRQIINQNQKKEIEEEIPKKKGFFEKMFGAFQKPPLYKEEWVRVQNSNATLKQRIRCKVDKFMLAFTANQQDFIEQSTDSMIRFNRLQERQLRQVLEKRESILVLKIFLISLLVSIIMLDIFAWQRNQLIYTFVVLFVIQLLHYFKHNQAVTTARKYSVDCYTTDGISINKSYNIDMLLSALKQINNDIIIYESIKEKELMILDKNNLFQALYFIKLSSASEFKIFIYCKNYSYISSIIDNFAFNFFKSAGIWQKNQNIRKKVTYVNLFEFKNLNLDIEYNKYKETTSNPISSYLFVAKKIVFGNWEIIYEGYALLMLLQRMLLLPNSTLDMRKWWSWIFIIAYSFTIMKIAFLTEKIFLGFRNHLYELQKQLDEATLSYYKNISHTAVDTNRIDIQAHNFICKYEVWMVCISLLIASYFDGSQYILPLSFLLALKVSFIQNRKEIVIFFKQIPTVAFVLVVGVFMVAYSVFLIAIKLPSTIFKCLRRTHSNQQQQRISRNARQAVIKRNNIKLIRAEAVDYKELECGICIEGYPSEKELVFQCSSKHVFHEECILKWINSGNIAATRKCPLCRVDLFQ